MTKTSIEIAPEKLSAAMKNLGTTTQRETVDAALDLVNRQAAQRRFIQKLAAGGAPGFTPESVAALRGKRGSSDDVSDR